MDKENTMRKWQRVFILMAACAVLGQIFHAGAARAASSRIPYSVTKGKFVNITKITKTSNLPKGKKKKVSTLTWRSNNKKVAKISGKKIKAVKKGTAKITGYTEKNKKMISIRFTVKEPPKPNLVRKTIYGKVRGKKTASGKTMIWYGLPYGADTSGENRWRAPQPLTSWTGIRSAVKAKKKALHYSGSEARGYAGTEDCLYVNVYRPYTTEKNLPVLVFLHGGGNCNGTANVKFSKMASSMNIVIVSVSFRVGAFGFLSHPALQDGTDEENSGNFALLDIRESLLWVQTNVGYFGGDADNVTLSGFSGGARDVLMCLLSKDMEGLFHKAFVISGGFTLSTPEEGKKSAEKKLAAILVDRGMFTEKSEAKKFIKTASDLVLNQLFRSLTTSEVAGMCKKFDLRMGKFPQGFTDGTVIPEDWANAIASGDYNQVPLLIGSDATEFSSFAWSEYESYEEEEMAAVRDVTDPQHFLEHAICYGSMLQSRFYLEETARAVSRDPMHQPIYTFRMNWGTSSGVSSNFYSRFAGAYHGQSKDFLLGTYKHRLSEYSPDAVSEKNETGRKALTRQMRSYLYNFMKKGNPNGSALPPWTRWNSSGKGRFLLFDAGKKKVKTGMSTSVYDKNSIFRLMQKELGEAEYTLMVGTILKGRLFMPDNVPAYQRAV